MQIDPHQSLLLAFRHLDAFSVPGIGTFRRKYFGAVVDHKSKKVLPPGERFVLEKGEMEGVLENFYFRYLDLKIGKAKEMVRDLGDFVREELNRAGKLLLPGVGELKKEKEGFDLAPATGDSAVSANWFGLAPVTYSFADVEQPDQERKKKVAKESLAKQAPVQPPPPPRKRRRRFPVWIIVVLLLVLLGSGAGMIWPDQFMDVLGRIGLVERDADPEVDPGKTDSTNLALQTDTASTAIPEVEHEIVDATRPAEDERVEDARDPSEYGSYAERGQYYLIAAATRYGQDASDIAREYRGDGVSPRVIAPRGNGYFKVSLYNDADKMKVIGKMVEWKNRFPVKTWIYWIGM